MGCHTWCSENVDIDKLSLNDMKNDVLKYHKGVLSYWDDKKYLTSDEYSDLDKKEISKELTSFQTIIQNINNNVYNSKEDLLELYAESKDDVYFVHNGNLYKDSNDFHDPFRVGYDDDTYLSSYDECIKYIQKKDAAGANLNHLKEIWDKNPDGLIYFG